VFFRTPAEEPPLPDLDEMEKARSDLSNGMLSLRESLTPAFDAADGMRADLLARGWSPSAAEILTVTWLQRMVMNCTPLIGIGDLK
jgi:hypothetical protein